MAKAIGIDLGTTNSVVAVMEGGKPTVIINSEGNRLTASVVGFAKNGERLVGQLAKRQAVLNPQNTIYSAKRFIGRRYPEVQSEIKNRPFNIVAGPNDAVRFDVGGQALCPGGDLGPGPAQARRRRGQVPGREGHRRRDHGPGLLQRRPAPGHQGRGRDRRPQRAAHHQRADRRGAGLRPRQEEATRRSWSSTSAAAPSTSPSWRSGDGVFEVKSTTGDTHLGGDDFDKRIVDWMADEFQRDQGIDLRKDRQALQRLTEAAEKAKIELSTTVETTISLPFVTADAAGPSTSR